MYGNFFVENGTFGMKQFNRIFKHFLPFYAMILIDLIVYLPVNNISVMSRQSFWVEPVLGKDKCVLLKDTMQ